MGGEKVLMDLEELEKLILDRVATQTRTLEMRIYTFAAVALCASLWASFFMFKSLLTKIKVATRRQEREEEGMRQAKDREGIRMVEQGPRASLTRQQQLLRRRSSARDSKEEFGRRDDYTGQWVAAGGIEVDGGGRGEDSRDTDDHHQEEEGGGSAAEYFFRNMQGSLSPARAFGRSAPELESHMVVDSVAGTSGRMRMESTMSAGTGQEIRRSRSGMSSTGELGPVFVGSRPSPTYATSTNSPERRSSGTQRSRTCSTGTTATNSRY
jgi:hypothetical protein